METFVRKTSIDLGLAVLTVTRKPDKTYTHTQIAQACECSEVAIRQIERRALEKLRRALASLAKREQITFAIARELNHKHASIWKERLRSEQNAEQHRERRAEEAIAAENENETVRKEPESRFWMVSDREFPSTFTR